MLSHAEFTPIVAGRSSTELQKYCGYDGGEILDVGKVRGGKITSTRGSSYGSGISEHRDCAAKLFCWNAWNKLLVSAHVALKGRLWQMSKTSDSPQIDVETTFLQVPLKQQMFEFTSISTTSLLLLCVGKVCLILKKKETEVRIGVASEKRSRLASMISSPKLQIAQWEFR